MRQIPTRAVKAVIRNSSNEILFLRRHKKREGVTNWDLPGGLVEEGEALEQALLREVEEEIGASVTIGKKLGSWSFFRPLDGKTVSVTNFQVTLDEEGIELSDEHDEAAWFTEGALEAAPLKDPSILLSLR